MPQQNDEQHAGELRDVDFKYRGGIGEDQVTTAKEMLANPLPHVEKNTDIFGTVDTSAPLSLSPEEMIDIPPLENERTQKDNALLETLMAKEIQAKISGNIDEEKKISAQIALLHTRMESH